MLDILRNARSPAILAGTFWGIVGSFALSKCAIGLWPDRMHDGPAEQVEVLVTVGIALWVVLPTLSALISTRWTSGDAREDVRQAAIAGGMTGLLAASTGWTAGVAARTCTDVVALAEVGTDPDDLLLHLTTLLARVSFACVLTPLVGLLGGSAIGALIGFLRAGRNDIVAPRVTTAAYRDSLLLAVMVGALLQFGVVQSLGSVAQSVLEQRDEGGDILALVGAALLVASGSAWLSWAGYAWMREHNGSDIFHQPRWLLPLSLLAFTLLDLTAMHAGGMFTLGLLIPLLVVIAGANKTAPPAVPRDNKVLLAATEQASLATWWLSLMAIPPINMGLVCALIPVGLIPALTEGTPLGPEDVNDLSALAWLPWTPIPWLCGNALSSAVLYALSNYAIKRDEQRAAS